MKVMFNERGKKMCILIVEDDEEIVGYIECGLFDLGYFVVWVDNGEDVLEMGVLEYFDMIVLDCMMLWFEGLDVLCGLCVIGVIV